MTTRDREFLENILNKLSGVDDGSDFLKTTLIEMANHIEKCEQQSRTDKERELLVLAKNWLNRRLEEWEKANNKTTGIKVYAKENALVPKDSQDKLIEKHKALEPWKKLTEEDKAFLKSRGIKP